MSRSFIEVNHVSASLHVIHDLTNVLPLPVDVVILRYLAKMPFVTGLEIADTVALVNQ